YVALFAVVSEREEPRALVIEGRYAVELRRSRRGHPKDAAHLLRQPCPVCPGEAPVEHSHDRERVDVLQGDLFPFRGDVLGQVVEVRLLLHGPLDGRQQGATVETMLE